MNKLVVGAVIVAIIAVGVGAFLLLKQPEQLPPTQPSDESFEWVSDITPGLGKRNTSPAVSAW